MPEIPPMEGKQPSGLLAPPALRAPARRRVDYLACGVFAAGAAVVLAWLPLIRHRAFDPDEFEHSHAAWSVFKGMLPYRDFFEHHTPWYYYLLSPLFRFIDVASSIDGATRFLLVGRAISVALAILSAFLIFQIGRLCQHRKAGLVAGLLLISQPFFLAKAMEIRPDVLAMPFYLACLWLLLRGLATGAGPLARGLRYFAGAGFTLGAAVMCTQKMLFALPGILAGLAIWSLSAIRAWQSAAQSHPQAGAGRRALLVAVFLLGASVPVLSTWAAFAFQGAGTEFITNNFLLNARWKHFETGQLQKLFETSWPVLLPCVLGSALALSSFLRGRQRPYGAVLLLCTLVGFFAGLAVMPSAHGQYYLMPLPIACLFAAKGLLFMVEGKAGLASVARHVVALVLLGVLPFGALREMVDWRNDGQLARLRFVLESTRPEDVVMDGWEGLGVFRPHAFHYFFIHPETAAILSPRQLNLYLIALERGQVRPRMIAMDRNLVSLGPRFIGFVRRNYVSKDGFIYFATGFWQPQRRLPLRVP